jgi:hypothetical protein
VAELTAYITSADVQAALSAQAYARLYAKNGGSTVDAAFLAARVAEANSVIRTITRAAFPEGLYQVGDTVDPMVVGAGVDICNGLAAGRHTASNEMGGYYLAAKAARDLLKLMNRDHDARPPGSSSAPSKPRASVTNVTDADGAYTNPLTRAADRRDGSDF